MLCHPPLGLDYLVRISGGRQNLRNQCIRVQCNGSYELIQLLGTLLSSLRRWLRNGSVSLGGEPVFIRAERSSEAILICQEFDAAERRSCLIIFDAHRLVTAQTHVFGRNLARAVLKAPGRIAQNC